MIKYIPLNEIYPVLREVIDSGSAFTFIPGGRSMLPAIVGSTDKVTVKSIDRPIKRHDIVLYRRATGQFVLHRVIGKDRDGYIMCGDNQYVLERKVTDDMLIAVVTAYEHDGCTVTDFAPDGRRAALRRAVRPVRSLCSRAIRRLKSK